MIPILYESTETSFTTNGLGKLSDCITCTVTEERNGVYECEFEYPITGIHYEDILEGRIIAVTHDTNGDVQPFDIYKRSEPLNGIVTFYANHVSYRQSGLVVKPFTASTCENALQKLSTYAVDTNPFTYWTNKSVSNTYTVTVPTSAKALLGGQENSILDVFGTGEYEFDKWDVNLYVNRGSDNGVTIRYGKNLAELVRELDYSEAHNGIVPYYVNNKTNSTEVITLPEWVLYSSESPHDGRNTVFAVDMSDKFKKAPSIASLRSAAQSLLDTTSPYLPKSNITLDMVMLYQTEEYKEVAPLEQVKLCDIVTIHVPSLGIDNIKIKVIKLKYNVLLDRYDEIELGDPQATFYQVLVQDVQQEVEKIKSEGVVVSIVYQYCLSSSRSSFIAYGDWQTTYPDYVSGYYYWRRTVTYYNDGTVEYGDPMFDQSIQIGFEADIAAENANAAATTASGIASEAIGIANTKRRVFNSTPTPPYDLNDMWFDGTHNNTYLCTTAKSANESYAFSDWTLYSTDVSNHFWADASGAHIAENSGDLTTGSSQTLASTGTVILRNGKLVTSWTGSSSSDAALNFYDCSNATAQSSDLIASYARAGITMYANNKRVMAVVPSGMSFYGRETVGGVETEYVESVFGVGQVQLGREADNHLNITTTATEFRNGSSDLVGSIEQENPYYQQVEDEYYSNAMILNASNYFALKLGTTPSYGENDPFPRFETNGLTTYLNFGKEDVSLELTDDVTVSGNTTSYNGALVTLNNSGSYYRDRKTTFFVASTESVDCQLGVGSGGDNAGVFVGRTYPDYYNWLIYLNSSNDAVIPQAGAITTTSSANLHVSVGGQLSRYTSSSRRYKTDIEDLTDTELEAEKLYDVKVRQFKYRDDYLMSDDLRYRKNVPGFIVEEMMDVYPIAIDYEDEKPEDWNERYLIPPMLKLIQDQKELIDELTARVEALERR